MFFRKKEKKCVFCAAISADNIFSRDYGYHCSSLDRCKEMLVYQHVRKNPLSEQEAFRFLISPIKHDVFLSSIEHELRMDEWAGNWGNTIKIMGAILVSRNFRSLKEDELHEKEFPDSGYECKIPVKINIQFDSDSRTEPSIPRIMGRAQFSGAFHENYGVTSNRLGAWPIVISMDFYAPDSVKETIQNEVKSGLIVKNIYDSAFQERLRSRDFSHKCDDGNFIERQGLRGLNYSLNTKFVCEFCNPVKEVNCIESARDDGAGFKFLDIRRWSLESKL
jgi:hypothetical protein